MHVFQRIASILKTGLKRELPGNSVKSFKFFVCYQLREYSNFLGLNFPEQKSEFIFYTGQSLCFTSLRDLLQVLQEEFLQTRPLTSSLVSWFSWRVSWRWITLSPRWALLSRHWKSTWTPHKKVPQWREYVGFKNWQGNFY